MESLEFESEPGAGREKSASCDGRFVGLIGLAAELHPDSQRRDRRKWSCLREKLESIKARHAEASRHARILSRYVE